MNEVVDARPSRPQPRVHSSALGAWFDHHLYSFVASLGRVARKPWSTLLTVGVMAVALALPLGLWLVLGNVERFSGDVADLSQPTSAGRDGNCLRGERQVTAGFDFVEGEGHSVGERFKDRNHERISGHAEDYLGPDGNADVLKAVRN